MDQNSFQSFALSDDQPPADVPPPQPVALLPPSGPGITCGHIPGYQPPPSHSVRVKPSDTGTVGDISGVLIHTDGNLIERIPLVGRILTGVNDYVSHKIQRGVMTQAAVVAFERHRALPRDERARGGALVDRR